jgi:hypothetical protein
MKRRDFQIFPGSCLKFVKIFAYLTKVFRQITARILDTRQIDEFLSNYIFFAQFLSNNTPNSHCEATALHRELLDLTNFFNPLSIQLKSNALKNGTLTLHITELLLLFFFELTTFSAFFSTAGELKSPLI